MNLSKAIYGFSLSFGKRSNIKNEDGVLGMKKVIKLLLVVTFMGVLGGCGGEKTPVPSQGLIDTQPTFEISTVSVTRDSESCIGENYQQLEQELRDAGFLYVNVEPIEDLTYSEGKYVGVIDSVSINGETSFAQGQEFAEESSVVIRYHDYRSYTVNIHIDFTANLLFSKYDVNFLVDNELEGKMKHGTDTDFELSLKAGDHTFSFQNAKDSSVNGKVSVAVNGNMRIDYRISCSSDEVEVKTDLTEILECDADGHIWNEATCDKAQVCAICGKTEGNALGHQWTEATCSAPKTCSVCGKTTGEPLEHSVTEWTISQTETCGSDGIKTGVCENCLETVEERIPKTGVHTFGEWKVTSEPTCTDMGVRKRVCAVCQYEEREEIEPVSHNYEEAVITEATYYKAGTKGQKCSICGIEGETSEYHIYYETGLRKIFDAYRANEISAHETYKGMYVEFSAKISSIEKGGLLSYGTITIEVSNGTWFEDEVECKIKTAEQLEVVKTLSVGNTVKIKGKITSVAYYKDLGSNMYIDIVEIK